jgi:hypothetical protein
LDILHDPASRAFSKILLANSSSSGIFPVRLE